MLNKGKKVAILVRMLKVIGVAISWVPIIAAESAG
jgi:hypothetical protein